MNTNNNQTFCSLYEAFGEILVSCYLCKEPKLLAAKISTCNRLGCNNVAALCKDHAHDWLICHEHDGWEHEEEEHSAISMKDILDKVREKHHDGKKITYSRVCEVLHSYWKDENPQDLEFGDLPPCDIEDCWYGNNTDRLKEYDRSYVLTITDSRMIDSITCCDVCFSNNLWKDELCEHLINEIYEELKY